MVAFYVLTLIHALSILAIFITLSSHWLTNEPEVYYKLILVSFHFQLSAWRLAGKYSVHEY